MVFLIEAPAAPARAAPGRLIQRGVLTTRLQAGIGLTRPRTEFGVN